MRYAAVGLGLIAVLALRSPAPVAAASPTSAYDANSLLDGTEPVIHAFKVRRP